MQICYGLWRQLRMAFINAKPYPGLITTDAHVIEVIQLVQAYFTPWKVGICSCNTEMNPANLQIVHLLDSAEGFPNLPTTAVGVTITGCWLESDYLRRAASHIFLNRLPAKTRPLLALAIAHELGHAAGLEHNPNTTSVMFERLTASVRTFDANEVLYLNNRLVRRTPQSMAKAQLTHWNQKVKRKK